MKHYLFCLLKNMLFVYNLGLYILLIENKFNLLLKNHIKPVVGDLLRDVNIKANLDDIDSMLKYW